MKKHEEDSATATGADVGRVAPRQTIFDAPSGRGVGSSETAATLGTLADMVRRIMRADTSSIASFSAAEKTVTWRAMSGFRTLEEGAGEIVNPLRGEFAERAAEADESVIEVRGLAGDLPASEFPLHSAEGLRDLALAPLKARGETLGVMVAGYRAPHRLTAEERHQLEGLAEMAALALDNARLFETIGTAKRIWEQTFDAIPDGIIVHDDRMSIVRCNLEAAEMMDMRPAEVIGMSCADAFARLFGERAAAYHMKESGARTSSSFELQAEDGRRYLVSVAPLTHLGGRGRGTGSGEEDDASRPDSHPRAQSNSRPDSDAPDLNASDADPDAVNLRPAARGPRPLSPDPRSYWSVITWSDITALSEVQEQLARTRRLATVGQLAAGVAHEINNPLAAITTCAEATLRGLHASPETAALVAERKLDYYLEEIVRQTLRCKEITRGLLDLSRQRRARRTPVELNALVEQSVRLFEQRGEERGVTFSFAPAPALGDVALDEAMVRQILDNLLSNALDAVGEGGRVSAATELDEGRVIVEVADDGPGIPPETLSRIFDPFFTTKDPGRGSGLGLAISLTMAEALGGALTAESKPGAGTRFRLWLPRRAPDQS